MWQSLITTHILGAKKRLFTIEHFLQRYRLVSFFGAYLYPYINTFLELSLNLCQLSDLDSLPSLPALYKLQLNDNKISDIKSIPEKCPSLLELTLSGNKKISSIDQLKPISTLKSLLKIDVEGCAISEKENYRKELFDLCATLAEVDGFDAQGNEVDGRCPYFERLEGTAL